MAVSLDRCCSPCHLGQGESPRVLPLVGPATLSPLLWSFLIVPDRLRSAFPLHWQNWSSLAKASLCTQARSACTTSGGPVESENGEPLALRWEYKVGGGCMNATPLEVTTPPSRQTGLTPFPPAFSATSVLLLGLTLGPMLCFC